MISYHDALRLIADTVQQLPAHCVDRNAAQGLIAASALDAALAIPPFANSAMDGFALHALKTHGASTTTPYRFKVGHCLAAGDVLDSADQNLAVEIMTGAKIPAGFDTIVPIELVQVIRNSQGDAIAIELDAAVPAGQHVRLAGEDFCLGQRIAAQGSRLHAGHIAALAATGIHEVPVRVMPGIEIFSTGKEVSDDYHQPLKDGEIYNSNAPYLLSQFKAAGIPVSYAGNIGDDAQAFVKLLHVGSKAHIVISSGAVSMGKWDFIPELLQQNGAQIIFHGVAIKPGKPILFARLKDGRYYFGLPGNPVSAAVGLRFFVWPLIRQLLGMPAETGHYARLAHDFEKKGRLRQFLKAHVASNAEGQWHLRILDGQQSFKLSPLLQMNCWAIIDETQQTLHQGDALRIVPMPLFSDFFSDPF